MSALKKHQDAWGILYSHGEITFIGGNVWPPAELPPWLEGFTIAKAFATRKAAREHIKEHYGHLAHRRDLRGPPHNWRMPVPVRIRITVELAP